MKWTSNNKERNEKMRLLSGVRYAHRGLYNNPSIPENSRMAFRRAVQKGFGAELDVHLLSDGTLAVMHDSLLMRMTGKEGVIEDCTYEDLSSLYLSGTTETVPTFQDVLQIFQGKMPLIIELKTYNSNAAALTQAVCKVLDDYAGLYCLESFDPQVLVWLRKNRPDIIRGQLSMDFIKERGDLTLPQAIIMTHLLHVFIVRPDFIAYRFKDRKKLGNRFCLRVLGIQGVSWTLRKPGEVTIAEREGLWPIFENKKVPKTVNKL